MESTLLESFDESNDQSLAPITEQKPTFHIASKQPQEIQDLIFRAENEAKKTLNHTKRRYRNRYVYINPDDLEETAESAAWKDIPAHFSQKGTIDSDELRDIYVQAFINVFKEYKDKDSTLGRILTASEWGIWKLAKKDRAEAPPNRTGQYHSRDIAVIRAIRELDIPFELANGIEQLRAIHAWADEYGKFYHSDREGEEWSEDPTTF